MARVIHQPATGEPTAELASRVEWAEGRLAQARGLMFRRSLSEGSAMVFPFAEPRWRSIHMAFVPFALDVLWLRGGAVVKRKRLRPWVGVGWATADTVIELPAGAAAEVAEGDRVVVVDDGEDAVDRTG